MTGLPCARRQERPIVKDQETVQKFIELRAQGVSYRDIAKQLDVAPSTLTAWSRQHQHLLQNLQTIEWEDFLARTLAPKQQRIQAIADQLRRLETELAARDLASVPTARLAGMVELQRRRLERECGSLKFSAAVQLSRDDETREAIQEWPA
jgi:transposase-like protein